MNVSNTLALVNEKAFWLTLRILYVLSKLQQSMIIHSNKLYNLERKIVEVAGLSFHTKQKFEFTIEQWHLRLVTIGTRVATFVSGCYKYNTFMLDEVCKL